MATTQNKLTSRIGSMTTSQLCEVFRGTTGHRDEVIPVVRGAIMDELEARNKVAFDRWMDSEQADEVDSPGKFFL